LFQKENRHTNLYAESHGLSGILPFVFPDGRGLLMILSGYFDESISQKEKGGEPICLAGYVFKPTGYKQFNRRWRAVLKHGSRRFSHFHMTDLYAGHKEYEGMTMADRAAILDKAVDAIADYSYAGIGIYFNQQEFESRAPKGWLDLYGSIYSGACQMVLQLGSYWLRKQRRCHLPVLYVFESGHRNRAQADAILASIGRDEEMRRRCHYKNHLFEEKHREYGLQAADLLAWSVVKMKTDPHAKSMGAFQSSLLRLGKKDRERTRLFEATGARLDRLFAEQMKDGPRVFATVGPGKRKFR